MPIHPAPPAAAPADTERRCECWYGVGTALVRT